jgi:protein-tyrosine phosphatase
MAEGIFRRMLRERGLEDAFEVDSCGTGDWHAGESADPRALWVLSKGEADFSHTARRIRGEDFAHFDAIWVMDRANLRDLERAFPAHSGKARLLLEVPDPYYGDIADFEAVYATLEAFFQAHRATGGPGLDPKS